MSGLEKTAVVPERDATPRAAPRRSAPGYPGRMTRPAGAGHAPGPAIGPGPDALRLDPTRPERTGRLDMRIWDRGEHLGPPLTRDAVAARGPEPRGAIGPVITSEGHDVARERARTSALERARR